MKAVLRFDLDDPDDRDRFLRCVHADEPFRALWQIQQLLRDMGKTDTLAHFSGEAALEVITDGVGEIIDEYAAAAMEAYR